MRTYSPNITAMRKKVKKAHKKNRSVGLLYLIGTLALIVLAFLPCLKIKFADGGQTLSILTFYKALLLAFEGNFVALFVFLLYLVMAIILLVEFFRIFSQFRRAAKKNERNVNACNRNLSAMEKMGDMFSFVFTSVVIIYFLIYIITPTTGDIMIERGAEVFDLWGYIFLAIGLLVHFVAGAIGGTSTLFIVGVSVEERKRTDNIMVFVLRNLIQVAATAAIFYFVTPILTIHNFLATFDLAGLTSNMDQLIGLVLQIVAIVMMIFLLKNAMSTIEYNLMGMEAVGIQRTAVFALLTGIVCVGAFVLDKNWTVTPAEMILNYLLAAIAGIVCFVLNLIVYPREKKEKAPEAPIRDWNEVKQPEKAEEEKKEPSTQFTGLPTSIDLKLVMPERDVADNNHAMQIGEAATKYEVDCPSCGKKLSVKQAPYHRCPCCGKVFRLQIGKIGKVLPESEKTTELSKKGKRNKRTKTAKQAENVSPSTPVLTEKLSFDAE